MIRRLVLMAAMLALRSVAAPIVIEQRSGGNWPTANHYRFRHASTIPAREPVLVGDGDFFDAARLQRTRRLLARFARADDENFVFGKRTENFLREFHRRRHHRDAAALNVRFGADMLGDVERALKRLVQSRTGVLVLEREFVGGLELAENFRLANDHRVETGGDFEKVVQAVRLGDGVKFIAQRAIKRVLREIGRAHV